MRKFGIPEFSGKPAYFGRSESGKESSERKRAAGNEAGKKARRGG